MLFYNSIGPNPRVVRIFMAERGIELPKTTIDLRGGENRQKPYLAKNPAGQMPCLELDDGSVLAEITAICEYLDEITPGPSLIGATAQERAECRMWTRRIDLNIVEPMLNGFRFSQGLKLFQDRVHCIPQAADDLKATAQERLAWLDGLIAGRTFIRGDSLSLADIMLFAFLDFGAQVGQPINPAHRAIAAHHAMMAARASAAA
ncbi:MAG: glutathione S-transferase family protein [Acetobacteraceae bacterium]|nr:MAG: glutathione S-transferase family protein [Acetobacteraceae bacterium]